MKAYLKTQTIIEAYEVSEYRDEPVSLMWDELLEGRIAEEVRMFQESCCNYQGEIL